MAYQYDPELMNQSLSRMGSSYRAPVSYTNALDQTAAPATPAPTTPQASFAPVSTSAPVTQAKDSEVPGTASAPAPTEQVSSIGQAAAGMQQEQKQPKKDGMERLGGLVGSVLAAYSGNYMGAAQGLQNVSGK